MSKEQKERVVMSELSVDDFADKSYSENGQFAEENSRFQQWMTEPEAKKRWEDINKDMSASNIFPEDENFIEHNEKAKSALIAIRNLIPKQAGDILFPNYLVEVIDRKVSMRLALGLSRGGFLREMNASKIVRKGITVGGYERDEEGATMGTPRGQKEVQWGDVMPFLGKGRRRN